MRCAFASVVLSAGGVGRFYALKGGVVVPKVCGYVERVQVPYLG